jgi:phage replication-related protein YjqB (UPF0714/DUF867 family)
MFSELLVTPGVTEHLVLRGSVGVLALHGGLEHRTAEMARAIGDAAPASEYAVVLPDDLRWHVPSIRFDPRCSPRLSAFLERVRVVLSLHGFGRRDLPDTVLLGGSNRRLARRLAAAIEARTDLRVVTDPERFPAGLAGMHPRNPVNLPEFGGVQVELSPGARTDAHAPEVVAAAAAVLAAEQRSLCMRQAG